MAGESGETTSNPSICRGTWCCALNPPARSEISAFSTFWIPERDQSLMKRGDPSGLRSLVASRTITSPRAQISPP